MRPVRPWQVDVFRSGESRYAEASALLLTGAFSLTLLGMVIYLPYFSSQQSAQKKQSEQAKKRPTQVELTPPPFVQVNPYGNQEHVQTAQEGAMNQRAAQETDPDPASREEGPQLEGEDTRFNRIVSGRPDAPDLPPAPPVAGTATTNTTGAGSSGGSAPGRPGAPVNSGIVLQTAAETRAIAQAAANTAATAAQQQVQQTQQSTQQQAQQPQETQTQPAASQQLSPLQPQNRQAADAAEQAEQARQASVPQPVAQATEAAEKSPVSTMPETVDLPQRVAGQTADEQSSIAPAEQAQLQPQSQHSPSVRSEVEQRSALPEKPADEATPEARPIPRTQASPSTEDSAPTQPSAQPVPEPQPVVAEQSLPQQEQPAPQPETPTPQPPQPEKQPQPRPSVTPEMIAALSGEGGDGSTAPGSPSQEESTDPNAPRPRPQIDLRMSAGPLRHQAAAASSRGVVAIDSKFSEFGAYQQRMVEAISAQWYLLAGQSRAVDSEYNTHVVLRFVMSDTGNVGSTEVVFTNASAAATLLCINAVESRSPFGPWNSDMKRVLGTSQTITFTFYYR